MHLAFLANLVLELPLTFDSPRSPDLHPFYPIQKSRFYMSDFASADHAKSLLLAVTNKVPFSSNTISANTPSLRT